MSTLSVAVVTYNSAVEIEACLSALLAEQVDDQPLQVTVVDSASTDDTLARVRDLAATAPGLTVVPLAANAGFAAGCNAALSRTTASFVAFVNPDCVVDPGCLQQLVNHLRTTPGCGVAAALLRYPDDSPQFFARREIDARALWATQTLLGRRRDAAAGGRELARRQYQGEFAAIGPDRPAITVDCPAAACVVVAREPSVRMSERLPLLFNDAELYWRLRRQGRWCAVVPAAGARHGYGTSLRRAPDRRIRAEFVASCVRYLQLTDRRRLAVLAWFMFAADALLAAAWGVLGPGGPNTRYAARSHARGTAGGLGWPGGDPPWLCPAARTPLERSGREAA